LITKTPKGLASYLAGLFESDGSIWIPSTLRAPSGKLYTPKLTSPGGAPLWEPHPRGRRPALYGDGAAERRGPGGVLIY